MFDVEELVTKTFLDYWGFDRLPFPKNARDEDTLVNPRFQYALTRLQQVLATKEIGVVVGEAGTGKSTLLNLFSSQVSPSRYRIIHLPQPQTRSRELYRAISSALGVNTSLYGADALKVNDLLGFSYVESGRHNILVIDEAHELSLTCLNELRLLTNATVKGEPLLTLFLFGQPSLATTLKLPAMIPLAQRISAWISLEGLAEEETINYIDWHLNIAGQADEIFPTATKKAIHRRSQGNPRLINRLAWESLNQASLDKAKVVTEELFAYVCKNLGPHLAN